MTRLFSLFRNNIFIVILLAWTIVPYFAYSQMMRGLAFLSILIFTVKYFKIGDKKTFFLAVFLIVYTFAINFIASDRAHLIKLLQLYIFVFLIYMSTIISNMSSKRKRQILLFILLFNLIALIGTYFGLLLDGHAARALSKSGEGAEELTKKGVGGYGTIYSNVVMIPILFYIKNKITSKKIKALVWVNLIIGLVVIVKANYLIAVLLTLFQLFFLLYHWCNKMTKVILVGVIFSLTVFSISNVDVIENVTYSLVEGTGLEYKHQDLFSQVKGEQSEFGSVEERGERYSRSFNMIFINPISGVLSYDELGKHSGLLDFLAQYGIVFFMFFLSLLSSLPKKILKIVNQGDKKYIYAFMIAVFLFGLLNNYVLHIGISYLLLASALNFKNKTI